MKIVNCKLKISKHGFTLIELLVAIAIVGILAAVVLVSMSSYGAKARSSKAFAQLSSAIPSMISCWGNGGNVVSPSPMPSKGGGQICGISPGYGNWPSATDDMKNYYYGSSAVPNLVKDTWAVALISNPDKKVICCNSKMNACKLLNWDGSTWPSGYCDPWSPSS